MSKFKFNICGGKDGFFEIKETKFGYDLILNNGQVEVTVLSSTIDQWGVFYDVMMFEGFCIAQEDCTISFTDAFAKALMKMKAINEASTIESKEE